MFGGMMTKAGDEVLAGGTGSERPEAISSVNTVGVEQVRSTEPKPELVIGLVGPVGTDLEHLSRTLEEKLSAFRYRCANIRVSRLISDWCDEETRDRIETSKGGERIDLLMTAGDGLRRSAKKGDALVPLIVGAIRAARKSFQDADGSSPKLHASNACYIVNSLKHPDEVKMLRELYGNGFVLISAFDSQEARAARLKDLIAKSHLSTETENYRGEAEGLIKIDAKRPGERIGQNVRETFPLGDFFLRVSSGYEASLDRFLDLLFGSPYLTPRRSEFLMFEASTNALRSADLSRQIGAVIVDRHGEIVSSGCNEVPKAGGGAYWPDEDGRLDNRDYRMGKDFNAVKKFDIVREFMEFLDANDILKPPSPSNIDEAVNTVLTGRFKELFKDLRVSNLIEFGRVVHAEMSALMRAAQRGIAVGGGEIYSTTFPCHVCARHIISAGITRVVYIEPYPKSMTAELYPEIVSIDASPVHVEERAPGNLVQVVNFEPFEGVAPPIFPALFRMSKRKDRQGYIVDWTRARATPKTFKLAESDLQIEQAFALEVDALPRFSLGQKTRGETNDAA
jgi:cytidine deaminase